MHLNPLNTTNCQGYCILHTPKLSNTTNNNILFKLLAIKQKCQKIIIVLIVLLYFIAS